MGILSAASKGIKALDKAYELEQAGAKALTAADRAKLGKQKFLEPSEAKNRLYHGTGSDIVEFDKSKIKRSMFGEGFHLSESPSLASFYANQFKDGQNVMPVYAAIKNPFELKDMSKWYDIPGNTDKEKTEFLKKQGFDGIKYNHGAPYNAPNESGISYVEFEPSQIKSAIGNSGDYDTKNPKITKAKGGLAHFGVGGVAKKGLKLLEEVVGKAAPADLLTAADRARVGKLAAEATAKQPVTRMSEALGNVGAEGKKVRVTQTDRTGAKYLGGAPFSMMQEVDPTYKAAKATWGVKTPGAAKNIANQADEDILFSTLIGSPTQHRSNELIFDKLYKAFQKSAKDGNLDQELRSKFNRALEPLFGEGADILDPKLRKEIDTFEKRAAVGNLLLGEGIGGATRGGSIIPGNKIMAETTEPMLRDVDTFSIGPRLFTLNKGVVTRPDLHPAFPEILQGEDLKQLFVPAPNEIALPDFNADFRKRTGRKKPGYYDLTMTPPGQPYPTQDITEDYLNFLQREGYAEGGAVRMAEGGTPPAYVDPAKLLPLKPATGARTRAGTPASDASLLDPLKALFNTGAGALKGMTAATLGAPADILNLLNVKSMGTAEIPYGSEYFREKMPSAGGSQEAKVAEELGTFMPLPPQAITTPAKIIAKGAKASAPYAGKLAQEFAEKTQFGLPLQMNVVKPKGGNFLAGEVERLTDPMKAKIASGKLADDALAEMEKYYPPEALATMSEETRRSVEASLPELKRKAAVNKFIDKKLNKYVKNEMATPEDPIRLGIERRAEEAEKLRSQNNTKLNKMQADIERAQASGKDTTLSQRDFDAAKEKLEDEYQIASRGLYHGTAPEGGWTDQSVFEPEALFSRRGRAGFPEGGMGNHPAARQWEISSDLEIQQTPAKSYTGGTNTESTSYGLNELVDEYNSNIVRDNPYLTKIDPETKIYKLDEMFPDTGLEFRHMIDELQEAMNPATNLPKSLRITPKDLEKMSVDDVSALSGKISAWRDVNKGKANLEVANNAATTTFKEYPAEINPKGVSWKQIKLPEGLPREEAQAAVKNAVAYEGDVMRHCVGGSGHCEPLLRGETEIYTLRDAKGEPHVTIEVEPKREYTRDEVERNYATAIRFAEQKSPGGGERYIQATIDELNNKLADIVEIKGKNNQKPKDEYMPFVQDFISSGRWGDIGDIKNTGMRETKNVFNAEELNKLRALGYEPNPVLTGKEIQELHNAIVPEGKRLKYSPEGNVLGLEIDLAEGGAVSNDSLEARMNAMIAKHYASGGAVKSDSLEDRMNKMVSAHYAPKKMAVGGFA